MAAARFEEATYAPGRREGSSSKKR
jgi:hypothetical protein